MDNRLLIVLLLFTLFSISNKAQTKIIAHRGFSEIAPENSLLAFQKAIEIGADYFELDVHQTKDSVLVVIHDTTINRTCSNNKTGKIRELYFHEIEDVRVGVFSKFGERFLNEKIPTLKESLLLAKNKIKVCVELKITGIENQVIELLDDLDMVNQVIIFSFHEESLINIKKINPEIKTLLLIDYANLKLLDFVIEIEAYAIGVGYSTTITKEFIKLAHKKKIKVFKWTVNEGQQMKELIDLNIDGIITNRPDLALKLNQ